MRGAWIIAKKELACFFYSPMAYILLFLAFLGSGFWFWYLLTQIQEAMQGIITPLTPSFFASGSLSFWVIIVLMTPTITMRMFAEEKRTGTLETLMTAPVSDVAVVLGKYLAALIFYLILWVPSLLYFVMVVLFNGSIDPGMFLSGFLGIFLSGALFLSIGLLASAISANQLVAAALAVVVNFIFVLGASLAVQSVRIDWMREVLQRLDYFAMMRDSLEIGILDSSHLIYFISLTCFFLFLTVRVFEVRKWQ